MTITTTQCLSQQMTHGRKCYRKRHSKLKQNQCQSVAVSKLVSVGLIPCASQWKAMKLSVWFPSYALDKFTPLTLFSTQIFFQLQPKLAKPNGDCERMTRGGSGFSETGSFSSRNCSVADEFNHQRHYKGSYQQRRN